MLQTRKMHNLIITIFKSMPGSRWLELCIRNTSDIRNDREDTSSTAFRKAAYGQFILSRYGYLGKGNRRVCPSCVVLKKRQRYPSVTGVYMGYRER